MSKTIRLLYWERFDDKKITCFYYKLMFRCKWLKINDEIVVNKLSTLLILVSFKIASEIKKADTPNQPTITLTKFGYVHRVSAWCRINLKKTDKDQCYHSKTSKCTPQPRLRTPYRLQFFFSLGGSTSGLQNKNRWLFFFTNKYS